MHIDPDVASTQNTQRRTTRSGPAAGEQIGASGAPPSRRYGDPREFTCRAVLIEDARNEANIAAQRIEQIGLSSTQAADVLKRRPSLASNVAAIDDRLSNDSRVRSRIARLEQPKAITGALGDRPPPVPASRDWDLAAGRLAQHQAAFDIDDGFGRRPGYLDDNAYSQSRASAIEMADPFIRPVAPRGIDRSVPELAL